MSVKLNVDSRFWGDMSDVARVFEVEGKTVRECLEQLVKKEPSISSAIFDKSGELTAVCFISINMIGLLMRRLETEVKEGDVIGVAFSAGG